MLRPRLGREAGIAHRLHALTELIDVTRPVVLPRAHRRQRTNARALGVGLLARRETRFEGSDVGIEIGRGWHGRRKRWRWGFCGSDRR